MLSSLNLTAALFVATASAQNLLSGVSVLRAEDVLLKPYSSLPGFPGVAVLARRQSSKQTNSSIPSDVKLLPDGSLDFTSWDNITNAACVSQLSTLSRSSNPSGNCICYNLPMLDVQSGMFEADLRLYRISDPRDAFLGVTPSQVQVGVVYSGASVSPMKKVDTGSGSAGPSVNVTRRGAATAPDENFSGPTLLQSYMLVGQIDKSKMTENMSMSDLESLVMPILSLTATTPTGGRVSTNVSLNEAAFLTGVFSKDVVLSDFAAAQLAVANEVTRLKNGTVAFILPGTQLLVFPIGLIITGVWMLLGMVAYGYGTYERMQYAKIYARRSTQAK